MDEREEQLIERFLAGDMTPGELAGLAERRSSDRVFNQEVEEYILARKALVLDSHDQLRVRFESLDKEMDTSSLPGKKKTGWGWKLIAVVTMLVLGFLAWKYLFYSNNDAVSAPDAVQDTIQQNIHPIPVDSTVLQRDEDPESENQYKPPSQETEQNKAALNGQEIFADHFEPYRDAMMDPTTRGESKATPLDEFRIAYWEGKFKDVPALFQKMDATHQQNDNYRFQLASALLENGKENEAIPIFESIIEHNRSRFVTEAYYYLGLGYLKKENIASAKKWLNVYISLEKAKQKERANEVLRLLEK